MKFQSINLTYAHGSAGSNNGQISGITDGVDNGRTVNYGYDPLARLSTALTVGSANHSQWGLSMSYDRYGNRTAQTVTAGTGPSNSVSVDATTNRIVGLGYDANGNMTNDGSNTLVYDGENRALSATNGSTSGTYTYDGNGLRVTKASGSTTTVYIFAGSKVIAEYDNGAGVASPSREYIYSGNTLLAKVESGATTYYHADHLSARVLTDSSGNTLGQRGHYPFGETWYETGTTTKFKFTTYERDSESGNDYAMARYNINRLGRFSAPDPLRGSISDPQSLNRYSYVRSDPVDFADPSGLLETCSGVGEIGLTGCVPIVFPPIDYPRNPPDPRGGGDPGILGGELARSKQPPPPPGYKQCIQEALQEVIAATEGTGSDPNNGYGTNVRGTITNAPPAFAFLIGSRNIVIMDPEQLPGHPNLFVGSLNSTAFGRYQITHTTAMNYGFTDFSPRGQDASAEVLMGVRNMVVPAMNGDIMQALRNGNREWTSLPGGSQQNISVDPVSVFNQALRTLPDCL